MPTVVKKLLLTPALRTARPRQTRRAPSAVQWQFTWCLYAPFETFMHLVLRQGEQALAHWRMPMPAAIPDTIVPGLWLQVTPGQAVPTAGQAMWQGTGYALGLPPAAVPTQPATLQAGRLLLQLPGAGVAELYVLMQLRSGGQGWLLSKMVRPY